jgi:hypothetical protein
MVSSPLDDDEVRKQKHYFSQQTFLVGGRKMGWGGEGRGGEGRGEGCDLLAWATR